MARKGQTMALFMDIHTMDGPVSAEQVAGAHCADLETQGRYGVDYRRYWGDEGHRRSFCPGEGPGAQATLSVRREALSLVADPIFPVTERSRGDSATIPYGSHPPPA